MKIPQEYIKSKRNSESTVNLNASKELGLYPENGEKSNREII
jgi:hypothetical protein